jgi:general secretion pathway protein K
MKNRGIVLISVLWVVLVLSLISFSLASAVRVEMNTSQNAFDSDRAFFMAKGSADVLYRSFINKQELPESTRVQRNNDEYLFAFNSGQARVRFEFPGRRIDVNRVPATVLASMFDSLGVAEQRRNELVDSILDWRDNDDIPHLYGAEINDYQAAGLSQASNESRKPRNGPFQSIDEMLFVRNVTPELFYGSLRSDPDTGRYQRVPGLRDLVTVNSSRGTLNPNLASRDVLAALPQVTSELADRVVTEREAKTFANAGDLTERVPALLEHEALQYLTFENEPPAAILSTATIASSGVSRTVRILFTREEGIQFLSFAPLLYRRIENIDFNRWQYE